MDWNDLLARYRSERGGRPKREALAEEIARLSTRFTHPHERARLPSGYLDSRLTRAAYASYFAPANAEKVARVLGELAAADPGLLRRPALRVLDLGCGTGAAGLGLARARPADAPGRVTYEGIDISRPALDDAAWFLAEAAPDWDVRVRTGDLDSAGGPPRDLVLLIDTLNETTLAQRDPAGAGAAMVRRALDRVAPDGYLIVVEPALRTVTRLLHAIRDRLAASDPGLRVAAPCLHARPCPALAREDAWCHEERSWDRPSIAADIDRRIGHDKRWLKYAWLVLTRAGRTLGEAMESPAGATGWRAVTNRHDVKGKTRIAGCGAAGWCDLECLTRHKTDATRAFFALERGDLFTVTGGSPGTGHRRLGPDDRVTRRTP